jgi:O-antigen/teichoic acid export membrane protein
MRVKELLQKGFWTFLARSLGAGLMFLMTILFARWLGANDFGLFSLGLTIMTIMGVLARWGTDQLLIKEIGIHWKKNPQIASGYSLTAIKVVLIMSISISILLMMSSEYIANNVFKKPLFADVLFWFSLIIIPFSINHSLSESIKGTEKPIFSSYLQKVTIPAFAIIISSALWINSNITLLSLSQGFVVATIISLAISLYVWKTIFIVKDVFHVKINKTFKAGLPMLLISSGGLILHWSDTIIIGILGTAIELGIYTVASKTVLITSLILIAMNSITAPKYASLYRQRKLNELRKLVHNANKILLATIFLPTAILLAFPEWIMSLFGEEYIEGRFILVILTVAQFINVSTGSVGYLLTMTGFEKTYQRILIFSALMNITLSYILIQYYSSIGVAIATAISLIFLNLSATFFVRKKLGFWVFPLKRN